MSTILECKNLSKKYGHKLALDGINLSLNSGRIIGLLGPNGSGKTTLIKLINGLLAPTKGELFINGNAPGVETKENRFLFTGTHLFRRNTKGFGSNYIF